MGLKMYQITLPQMTYFGVGVLNTIGDEASKLGAKRALIVTDPRVYKSGLVDPVKDQLASAGLSVEVFSESEPEPTLPKLNVAAKPFPKADFY